MKLLINLLSILLLGTVLISHGITAYTSDFWLIVLAVIMLILNSPE